MKIRFIPSESEFYPRAQYWFIHYPYDSPDYVAINRLGDALHALETRGFVRWSLMADGSNER